MNPDHTPPTAPDALGGFTPAALAEFSIAQAVRLHAALPPFARGSLPPDEKRLGDDWPEAREDREAFFRSLEVTAADIARATLRLSRKISNAAVAPAARPND